MLLFRASFASLFHHLKRSAHTHTLFYIHIYRKTQFIFFIQSDFPYSAEERGNFSQQQHKKVFKCWMYVNDSHLFICGPYRLTPLEMMILLLEEVFVIIVRGVAMGKGRRLVKESSMRKPLICKFLTTEAWAAAL